MDIETIINNLTRRGVFEFDVYASGMFPAVGKGTVTEATSGYRAAWVRDNVHIAYAHHVCGLSQVAVRCVEAILKIYQAHQNWFSDVIEKRRSPDNPMNRPHIRFDGDTGAIIEAKWPHAQNDALGAFMWLCCRLILDGAMTPDTQTVALLSLMVQYMDAIQFYHDEDSGHWEEQRKISASSVGAVCAGLREFIALCRDTGNAAAAVSSRIVDVATTLFAKGHQALSNILPYECRQVDSRKRRRYDAALLFLVEPFNIVGAAHADRIVADVATHLQGEYGIRRYLMDSYWGPDYRTIPAEKRTIDLSDDIIARDDFAVEGQEAQWCIFDSIVSLYYGRKFQQSQDPQFLNSQVAYLQRALAQLQETPEGRLLMPEAYFIENGCYIPNDHLPLQWAQANLWRAVQAIKHRDNR